MFHKVTINKHDWRHAIHYTVYNRGNAISIEVLSNGTQLKDKYHTKKGWEIYKKSLVNKGFLFYNS